jgi:hypothetical protein
MNKLIFFFTIIALSFCCTTSCNNISIADITIIDNIELGGDIDKFDEQMDSLSIPKSIFLTKMNLMSFCWFKLTNQQGYKQLTRYNCINKEGSKYYVSYLGILDNNKYQKTKKILRNHVIFNHVFKNITSDGIIMYHCFNPDYKLTNVKVVKSNQISIILTFNESIELNLNSRYYNKLD